MKISKKLKTKIFKEYSFIMGIVAEGLGSQYNCFIEVKSDIGIFSNKKDANPQSVTVGNQHVVKEKVNETRRKKER